MKTGNRNTEKGKMGHGKDKLSQRGASLILVVRSSLPVEP